MPRRFPPPWSLEELNDACFVVIDSAGQKLAYVYYEDEPGRRSAAKLLTKDEARRIAANMAKLPDLLKPTLAPPFDFDRIELWGPELLSELQDLLPMKIREMMAAENPELIDDAYDRLFEIVSHDHPGWAALVGDSVSKWIEKRSGDRLSWDADHR
jgi:hypothetical protein